MLSTRVWLSEAVAWVCAVLWTANITWFPHDAVFSRLLLKFFREWKHCEGVTVSQAQMETSFPMKLKSLDRFYRKGDKSFSINMRKKVSQNPTRRVDVCRNTLKKQQRGAPPLFFIIINSYSKIPRQRDIPGFNKSKLHYAPVPCHHYHFLPTKAESL